MPHDATRDPAAFWGRTAADEEPLRERRFPLVGVQTEITRRIIGRYTTPGMHILDAGAGVGRYSIPLAAGGHRVTHLDFSPEMLERARENAAREGIDSIVFMEGDVTDLSPLEAQSFALTLCLDAPISYAYPRHEEALREVCRVTGEIIIIMVTSRSGLLPFLVDLDLSGDYLPPDHKSALEPFLITRSVRDHGVEIYPDELLPYLRESGKLIPHDYAFTVAELRGRLRQEGFRIVEIGGPGALARSIRSESLTRILEDPALLEPFIELSLEFDFDPHTLGIGPANLLAVARREG